MGINQRAMKLVTEVRDLISDKDDGIATGLTHVHRGTLRNWDVGLRLIVCRERGNVTILTWKFEEFPIRTGTNCVDMVINFIHGTTYGRVQFLSDDCDWGL